MDIKLLEDALVLIEEGTMSAAAARRNVTQPAFSRRIKSLEHWLGVTLVERHPNRVELTDHLIEREAEIRSILDTMRRFRQSGAVPRQAFIVASQHSLATSVFPEIYPKLSGMPGIDQVRLRTRNQVEAVTLFLKFEVDMLLSYQSKTTPRLPFDDTIMQRIWRRDVLLPAVGGPLRYELSAEKNPPSNTPLIRYPDDSEFGRLIRAQHTPGGFAQSDNTVVETAFAASVVSLIKLGTGIGWVPQSLVRDDLRRGEIIPISASIKRIPIDVVVSVHRKNELGNRTLAKLIPGS